MEKNYVKGVDKNMVFVIPDLVEVFFNELPNAFGNLLNFVDLLNFIRAYPASSKYEGPSSNKSSLSNRLDLKLNKNKKVKVVLIFLDFLKF